VRKLVALVLSLAPAFAGAATPAEGVELTVRRGFFIETDIGAFLTLGGADAYSNTQTYLQLGIGYDIGDRLELGVNFGIGASAADCFGQRDSSGNCVVASGSSTILSDNFTLAFIDANVAYLFRLSDRLYLIPKLAAGYTTLDPGPVQNASGTLVTSGVNVGGGLGLEYATSMDHFSIGIEATGRFVIGPNILALAIFPRVKYTF
jgi:hypothetical protein